jgi:hemolysin activation/secretion protein
MQKETLLLCGLSVIATSTPVLADYTVQLAAYNRVVPAVDAQNRLKDKVSDTYLLDEDGMTKLRSGKFATKAQAAAYADQLKASGIDAMVKPYTATSAEPASKILSRQQQEEVVVRRASASEPMMMQSSNITEPKEVPIIPVTANNFVIAGYAIDGNSLLAESDIIATLTPFVGDNKTFADVQKALDALQKRYVDAGYQAVRVSLPEQNLSSGSIRFVVIEGKITQIAVLGATEHDEANIRNSLPSLVVGKAPRLDDMTRELKVANENPSKNATVLMRNAGKAGELEALITVKDSHPQTLSATLDNTGSQQTGESRITAAYQHANLTNRDDVLRLQASTSVEYPDRYKTMMAAYHVPVFSTGGSVDGYVGLSDANSGKIAGGLMQINGAGQVIGVRYNQIMANSGSTTHSLFAGIERKNFTTNFNINGVDLDGSLLGSPDLEALPITAGYKGNWQGEASAAGWYAAYSQNSGGSKAETYNSIGSKQDYSLWRYGADYVGALALDMQLRLKLAGQKANNHLISGEQFAIGGYDNLRGLYERSLAADSSNLLTAELYSPDFGASIAESTSAKGLVFVDHLVAQNEVTGATSSSLTSAGLGVRLAYQKNLSLRADVARLVNVPDGLVQKEGDTYAHVGITVSH